LFPQADAGGFARRSHRRNLPAVSDHAAARRLLVRGWHGRVPESGCLHQHLAHLRGPAHRVPMVTLGFLQFMSPTLTLVIAVAFLGEHFSRLDVITFGCVWGALLIVGLEGRIS